MLSALAQLKDFFRAGPRTAEDYLHLCLHEPNFGYYQTKAKIGARGDFSTAATLGSGLARAIASWLQGQRETQKGKNAKNAKNATRGTAPADVIEVGPGNAQLLAAIIQALPRSQRRSFNFHLVDSSPTLQAEAKQTLGLTAQQQAKRALFHPFRPRQIKFHSSMNSALADVQGQLLIYSNELVDAFAPIILQWNGQSWDELGLEASFEGTQMSLRELALPLSQARLAELDCPSLDPKAWPEASLQAGQRIEIPLSYRNWLKSWLELAGKQCSLTRQLSMLTIDYGEHFPALYQARKRGTLRGYFAQQRLEGSQCWQRAGRQDLTFDVNFSTLSHWHEQLGLRGQSQNLAEWLQKWPIELAANDPLHQAAAHFQVREDSLAFCNPNTARSAQT